VLFLTYLTFCSSVICFIAAFENKRVLLLVSSLIYVVHTVAV